MNITLDGDTISVTVIFSSEANKKIRESAWFRHFNITPDGDKTHLVQGNEFLYALNVLTR